MIAAKEMLDGGLGLARAGRARRDDAGSELRRPRRARPRALRENRDCLLAALRRNFGEVGVSGEGSGLHLLWRLPPGRSRRRVGRGAGAAARGSASIRLASGGATVLTPSLLERRALVIGFGALPPQADRAGGRPLSRDRSTTRSTTPRPTSPSSSSACPRRRCARSGRAAGRLPIWTPVSASGRLYPIAPAPAHLSCERGRRERPGRWRG